MLDNAMYVYPALVKHISDAIADKEPPFDVSKLQVKVTVHYNGKSIDKDPVVCAIVDQERRKMERLIFRKFVKSKSKLNHTEEE